MPGRPFKIHHQKSKFLKGFPALVVDDDAKARIKSFLKTPEPKDASDTEKKRLKEQFEQLASALKYDGKCQIEIRFDAINYELVWQLQTDELVDRELTPPRPRPRSGCKEFAFGGRLLKHPLGRAGGRGNGGCSAR